MSKQKEYFKIVADAMDKVEQTDELTDQEKLDIFIDLEDEADVRGDKIQDRIDQAESEDEDE